MVKLYYTPTSCGAASFIAAFAAGVNIEVETVNLGSHTTASGADFYKINPKGNVPALVLDDGTVLNENAATLQWIADQKPGTVAAPNGTTERYLIQQALSYVSSEFHAVLGPLFSKPAPEVAAFITARLHTKLKFMNETLLVGKEFLVGDKPSVADFYLFITLTWQPYIGVDISAYPVVQAYFDKIKSLEVVTAALAKINGSVPPTTTL